MAKRRNFSEKQKLYMGVVAGILFGLALSLVLGSYGKFTAGLNDDETASSDIKNPSFEISGLAWAGNPAGGAQYSYSTLAASGWPTDGSRSYKVSVDGGVSSVAQVFVLPEGAATIEADVYQPVGNLAAGASIGLCDATDPQLATGPSYGVKCKATKRSSSNGGNMQTISVDIPSTYAGKPVELQLNRMYCQCELYWDNVRILDAQGRVI